MTRWRGWSSEDIEGEYIDSNATVERRWICPSWRRPNIWTLRVHYNVASLRKATLESQPRDSFLEDLSVNIGGALAATQLAAHQLASRGAGTILLTGGAYSLSPSRQYLSLSIGKAGIRAPVLGTFDSLRAKGIHIATVTVGVEVVPDSLAARDVGDEFWKLYSQPMNEWTAETRYPI